MDATLGTGKIRQRESLDLPDSTSKFNNSVSKGGQQKAQTRNITFDENEESVARPREARNEPEQLNEQQT